MRGDDWTYRKSNTEKTLYIHLENTKFKLHFEEYWTPHIDKFDNICPSCALINADLIDLQEPTIHDDRSSVPQYICAHRKSDVGRSESKVQSRVFACMKAGPI